MPRVASSALADDNEPAAGDAPPHPRANSRLNLLGSASSASTTTGPAHLSSMSPWPSDMLHGRASTSSLNGNAIAIAKPVALPLPVPVSVPVPGSGCSTAERVPARDPGRSVKVVQCTYDPLLDKTISHDKRRKAVARYRDIGMDDEDDAPPADPRLAMGRFNYINVDFHLHKARLRQAPYNLRVWPYDPKTSCGSGPPTQILVTGFNPLIAFSKLNMIFSSFGDIAESSNKMHPETGTYLGFATFRFRDSKPSRARPAPINAHDAAKRALHAMHGKKIDANVVRVEFDHEGRKSSRMIEDVLRKAREEEEAQRQAANSQIPTGPRPKDGLPIPGPPPPPPLPKWPAAPRPQPLTAPRPQLPTIPRPPALASNDVATEVQHVPHIFIPHESVPVHFLTVSHMMKRLKMHRFEDIRTDRLGYFIIFADTEQGREEAAQCYRVANGSLFFNYTMRMTLNNGPQRRSNAPLPPSGRGRSRSRNRDRSRNREWRRDTQDVDSARHPSTSANFPRTQRLAETEAARRQRLEEEADMEEEKKQRAKNFDPVLEAAEVIRRELRDHLMRYVRTKVAVPALIDFLDPVKHVAKRRKLNIDDPTTTAKPSWLSRNGSEERSPIGTPNSRADPIERRTARLNYASLPRIRKVKTAAGVLNTRKHGFNDPFARQRAQAKPEQTYRTLHHRLRSESEDDSDDEAENRDSVARDTEEPESRPRSRMSSGDEAGDKDDYGSWGPGEEDSMTEDSFALNDPPLPTLRKRKLDAPADSALKRQKKTDEELFGVTINRVEIDQALSRQSSPVDIILADADKAADIKREPADVDADASQTSTPAPEDLAKAARNLKKAGRRKKSKKSIFEEREALRKQEQALLNKDVGRQGDDRVDEIRSAVPDPGLPCTKTLEPEEKQPEEARPEPLDPTIYPASVAPALTLPPEFALDVSALQALSLKDIDRPDANKLKKKFATAGGDAIGDAELWLWQRDRVRQLNSAEGSTTAPVGIEGYYVPNPTGCARTEGVEKILNSEKSKYLPHHIKVRKQREERQQASAKNGGKDTGAAVSNEKSSLLASKVGPTSGSSSRATRVNNRRVVADLNDQRKSFGLGSINNSEILRFNALKKRKKPVKFARSAIHNWGLYAMENIPKDDMIIEYVGEEVRESISNIREARYLKSGIGSSYLFRIDEATVIDATKKGGIARFINHSCMPNCTAKIIKVEGSKRIVIYALRDIALNEELTYDYKFEREIGSLDRIPCLCGTAACKGFLN